ncbi:uncharacterized protein EAF01_006315 [Botrytis porri]|uniref:uncharacterized protein n=1 Tax=Botrytis porri TaxID=87229 RepID=UPI001902426E|nr:uncharacterized protein EAF01_006315 [Botrytis porri]KAF7903266.1 hypothetical protein EAF01_006315 [Botrytis porri]
MKGNKPTLGKQWIHNFLFRNPEIRTKRQIRINNQRVSGTTIEIINKFFEKLNLLAIIHIKLENRWNMDEAGIMEGQGLNGMVLGSAERCFIQKKQLGTRSWTSFIECIFATGKALLLLVIYKGKSIQQQWFSTELDIYKDWKFHTTENEWTTNETG